MLIDLRGFRRYKDELKCVLWCCTILLFASVLGGKVLSLEEKKYTREE